MTSLDALELASLLSTRCKDIVRFINDKHTLNVYNITTPYQNYLGFNLQFITEDNLKYIMQIIVWRNKDPRHEYHVAYEMYGHMITHDNRYPNLIEPEFHTFSNRTDDPMEILNIIMKYTNSFVYKRKMDYD